MFDVTIYIETSSHGPAVRSCKGTWLIEYIKQDGTPETRQGVIAEEKTTENAMTLEVMKQALEKLTKPCQIRINTKCEHVLNVMRNHWLPQWEKNEWKTAKGAEVKNKELWQQCRELMSNHLMEFVNEYNPYGEVMKLEIEKK